MPQFVVQKHAARRIHFDLRLELEGVLKSWALPKGPSLNPAERSLAIQVEDHPLEYAQFEGIIPDGLYGAGSVMLWDRGRWRPQHDPHEGLRQGRLVFQLDGVRLRGGWALIRLDRAGPRHWLLIKKRDPVAADRDAPDIRQIALTSVRTGRTMEEIRQSPEYYWDGQSIRPYDPARVTIPKSHATQQRTLRDAIERGPTEDIGRPDQAARPVGQERPPVRPHRSPKRDVPTVRVLDVTLTNPDRIYFPELLLTKRQLAEYYAQVAPRMMPLVKDRPLTLLRCPRGRDQHCFYQKHFDRGVPQGCRAVSVQERHAVRQYAAIDQPQGLVALAQLGALELHTWLSRRDRLDRPDQMVLDLDPGEGVSWGVVQEAAVRLHDALAAWNLRAFVRVTGGKGLHVIVPLERRHTWLQVRQVAGVLAQRLQAAAPDRFVAQAAKEKRSAHLFIDYLRNVRGATAIASYSSRGHPRAPIALPISWSELAETSSARILHVDQVLRGALASRPDPWSEMPKIRQRISRQVLQTCADEYVLKG